MHNLVLKDLPIDLYIGIFEYEKTQINRVLLDIDINLNRKVNDDDIENTLCYYKVCELLINKFEGSKYNLIEKMVCDVLKTIELHAKDLSSIELLSLSVTVKKNIEILGKKFQSYSRVSL